MSMHNSRSRCPEAKEKRARGTANTLPRNRWPRAVEGARVSFILLEQRWLYSYTAAVQRRDSVTHEHTFFYILFHHMVIRVPFP